MELFEASTRIREANRVPDLDEQQLALVRERFIGGIRAEAKVARDVSEPAA